jgi:hypothetical protein
MWVVLWLCVVVVCWQGACFPAAVAGCVHVWVSLLVQPMRSCSCQTACLQGWHGMVAALHMLRRHEAA